MRYGVQGERADSLIACLMLEICPEEVKNDPVPNCNATTTNRLLGHAAPNILCFAREFLLTTFSVPVILRPQIRGIVVRPAPREDSRKTTTSARVKPKN